MISNNQLRLHFYNYDQATKFKIENAHHTIKLSPIDNSNKDQFGLKLRPNDGEAFNSSMAEIITAEEEVEPVFEVKPASTGNEDRSKVIVHHRAGPGSNLHHQHNNAGLSANHREIDGNSLSSEETDDGSSSETPYGGAPTIKLDWLDDGNNEYKLRDIHFHWAERRDNGSEHAIDGRRAAMEVSRAGR